MNKKERHRHPLLARAVFAVNVLVAALLAVALGLVYWYAWRPLPETSGEVAAPVAAQVTVTRDALGVPHIAAASEEDALFAQGYCTAQERLWQMDALRRLTAGELAEVIGPAGLESDREARRLRLRRIAEQAYAALDGRGRAELAAYTRGVNHFIATHLDRLPVEFSLLSYGPRPWSGVDTFLVGLHMCRALASTWRTELAKARMLEAGDRAKVEFLFTPPSAPGDLVPGSNSWALAGNRTATGRPLLANDPHLDYSLPGIWFMTHLRAPGLNVSGVAIPGIPGIVIGHNERIAWGITNLGFDVQDLYEERFDARTGQYLYRGRMERARMERETIRVRHGRNEELTNWITVHGPVFITEGNRALALKWVAAEPGGIGFPFLEMDRARNWGEFTAAISRFAGPSSNLVYADVDGNIGYHAAGRLPIRHKFDGSTPVDGASGDFEWDGYIPFEQLPASFNPPAGVVISANQNPFPANYPYTVNGNFAPACREEQIAALLGARGGWRAADMPVVQKDVYSSFSRFLARQLVAAWDRRKASDPELRDAIGLLRGWNGQMDKDLAAPLIVTLAYQYFRKAVAESAAPGKGPVYDGNMALEPLEQLLRRRPAGWFEDYDRTLLRCLQQAVEEGRRGQGGNVRQWKYGRYLTLLIAHPVLHRVPWVGNYFDIGPAPMSGSVTTVKQTSARMGPSMRMSADLANWDRSLMNITAGQSGHPLSSHYKDQWPRYYIGESYPMQFERVQARSVLRLRPAAP